MIDYSRPETYTNKIIWGDCLDVMKRMPDKCVDMVLTDPPYGLNKRIHDGGTWATKNKFNACLNWDYTVSDAYWIEIFRISKNQIIWGGQYYPLKPSRCWLVWLKPYFPTMSDFESAWTSYDKNNKIFKEVRNPDGNKEHPTQKPISLMKWCIKHYSQESDLIIDPFLGSGTTAVAAYEMGRRFIGIEKELKYIGMARRRLDAVMSQQNLFRGEL